MSVTERLWSAVERNWKRRRHERSALVQVVKGVVAALVSYLVALHLLDSQVPSFGPFAALLVVQVTVYRSLTHALRYLVAVVAGLLCAGIIGLTMGQTVWTLVVLVALTLIIGQWGRLREFWPQAAVVGVFVFAAGGGDNVGYLVSLLLTVACGALVGTGINLILAPPIRFGDAAAAVDDVCSMIADILAEIAGQLRADDPLDPVDTWRERADSLTDTLRRARTEIDFETENARLNPRRLGHRRAPVFTDYRDAIDTVSRAAGELQGVTLALQYARGPDGMAADDEYVSDFLPQYADLLDATAEVMRVFGAYHRPDGEPGETVSGTLDVAFERYDELTGNLRDAHVTDARTIADCGALLVEIERLLSHVRRTRSRYGPEVSSGPEPAMDADRTPGPE